MIWDNQFLFLSFLFVAMSMVINLQFIEFIFLNSITLPNMNALVLVDQQRLIFIIPVWTLDFVLKNC